MVVHRALQNLLLRRLRGPNLNDLAQDSRLASNIGMALFSRVQVNRVTHKVIGAALEVHRRLGPGLLESAYHWCMISELRHQGVAFRSRVLLPITYRDVELEDAYEIDLLVADLVVVELKAVSDLAPVFEAQVLTYLKLTGAPVGLLINFHVPLIRHGTKRLFNKQHELVDDFAPGAKEKLKDARRTATNLPP